MGELHVCVLQTHQFTTATDDHLGHLLQAGIELTENLLGITVGALLNAGRFLTATQQESFSLLLGALAETQGLLAHSFSIFLGFLLQAVALLTDLLELLQRLLAVALMGFRMGALQLLVLLLELLKTASGFLLQLLTAGGLLLLELGGLGLMLLLEACHLAAGLLQHLLALLAALIPQFRTLPFRFLANAGAAD